MRRLWRVARVLAGVYLGVCVLAWCFQRRLVYAPDPRPVALPAAPGLEGLREVALDTSDGVRLAGWYRSGERPGTVLYFHGNAGHRGDRLEVARGFARRGWGLLMVDYRGYGGSGGEPSEDGLYLDAEACHAWAVVHAPGPLAYLGRSLGAAVAVELARRHPPEALLLQSPFDSLQAVASGTFGWLPLGLILRDRYESDRKIAALRCPVLVQHGTDDRIVPLAHGRRLFDLAGEPKRWQAVRDVGHNDLFDRHADLTWEAIDAFLREHLAPR